MATKHSCDSFPASEGATVVEDTLGCLRSIACDPTTQRVLNSQSNEGAYAAWQQTREHIFQEWMTATDPKNLQSKIRPLFCEAADHLRKNPPEGIDQAQLEECVDSLLASWGVRYEREFRPFVTDEGLDTAT